MVGGRQVDGKDGGGVYALACCCSYHFRLWERGNAVQYTQMSQGMPEIPATLFTLTHSHIDECFDLTARVENGRKCLRNERNYYAYLLTKSTEMSRNATFVYLVQAVFHEHRTFCACHGFSHES